MKLGKKKSIEEQNLKQQASVLDYVIIVIIGIILLYPLVWMFFATFKDNSEIFGSVSLLPKVWHFENYTNGWKGAQASPTRSFLSIPSSWSFRQRS